MEELKIPNHVGIILDGNGRWATSRGLNRSAGHKAGYENLKKLSIYILNKGVKYLSIYVFSTENFKRSEEEVGYLMKLFVTKFRNEDKFFKKHNVRAIFSGRREGLRKDVLESIDHMEEATKDCTGGVLNICLNYGSRYEIIDMVKSISKDVQDGKLKIEDIDEKVVNANMYQDLPNIDFLIRTSGELRLSNFMLWQSSYAEFYFPTVFFPDFDEKEFDKALLVYNKRDRRFGGINQKK